ncbi:hypothetical protein E2P81_ATG07543 [Venturia nashicola]|nr:hypothetical protein E2P81_ATG07543 [Venturia nashicola]
MRGVILRIILAWEARKLGVFSALEVGGASIICSPLVCGTRSVFDLLKPHHPPVFDDVSPSGTSFAAGAPSSFGASSFTTGTAPSLFVLLSHPVLANVTGPGTGGSSLASSALVTNISSYPPFFFPGAASGAEASAFATRAPTDEFAFKVFDLNNPLSSTAGAGFTVFDLPWDWKKLGFNANIGGGVGADVGSGVGVVT